MVEFWINRYWHNDTGIKTILYYAAILMHEISLQENGQIPTHFNLKPDLEAMVSLEERAFDNTLYTLQEQSILHFENGQLNLANGAFQIVSDLIRRDTGAFPPPINGVTIYRNDTQRFDLWIEASCKRLRAIFENKVTNLKITTEDMPRKEGRLLIFETAIIDPFLAIFFLNTKRMQSGAELSYMTTRVQILENERKAQMRRMGGYTPAQILDGTTGIRLGAAPTYRNDVAIECFSGALPTPLTGPINLDAILYWLENHPDCITEKYHRLLRFLYPFGGGASRGIVLANWYIDYVQNIKCT